MNDNQMIKTKKKDGLLSLILYVLAAILLIAAFISLAACQQNISAQLAQGVSVKGNELAILNIYAMSNISLLQACCFSAVCSVGKAHLKKWER